MYKSCVGLVGGPSTKDYKYGFKTWSCTNGQFYQLKKNS